MNKYIEKLISLSNNSILRIKSSFDGSDIFYEANSISDGGEIDTSKSNDKNRKIRNTSESIKWLGAKPSEIITFEGVEKYIEANPFDIYNNLIELLTNGTQRDKDIIGTAIAYWCVLNNKEKLFKNDISNLFDTNGNIKYNIINKFKGFIYFSDNLLESHNKNILDIKNNKNFFKKLKKEDLESRNEIIALRSEFRASMKLETELVLSKYVSWNNDFKYPDAAHIISVKRCIEEGRTELISDPNNGILLDPNTHRLFDRGELNTLNDLGICKKFINDQRIKYLKESKLLKSYF